MPGNSRRGNDLRSGASLRRNRLTVSGKKSESVTLPGSPIHPAEGLQSLGSIWAILSSLGRIHELILIKITEIQGRTYAALQIRRGNSIIPLGF
jgi:hypothetical protein